MTRLVFSDFDEYDLALRGVSGHERILRSRPQCSWELGVIDLNGVTLMMGRSGGASIFLGAGSSGCFTVVVPMARQETVVMNGECLGRKSAAWLAPARDFYFNSRVPTSWLSVTASSETLLSWLAAHEDEVNFAALNRNSVQVAGPELDRLVRLCRRCFQIDELSPDDIHAPRAERALRLALMDAMMETQLKSGAHPAARVRTLSGTRTLQRALAVIQLVGEAPIHMADLCRATGVSERTLRNVFHHHFGVAPHAYLTLTRLSRVHAAIRRAKPVETISTICADFGIWDCGRFAQHYLQMYGRFPSEDLAERRTRVACH